MQWQPDGLTIHTNKWFLGAGLLGAPPISLTISSQRRSWLGTHAPMPLRRVSRRESSVRPPGSLRCVADLLESTGPWLGGLSGLLADTPWITTTTTTTTTTTAATPPPPPATTTTTNDNNDKNNNNHDNHNNHNDSITGNAKNNNSKSSIHNTTYL